MTTKIKNLIALFITLCALNAYAQEDITKDRTLVYDHLTDTYLCSVPESMFDDGTVSAYHNDSQNVRFTFLPIVRLHGDFGYKYSEGTVDVIMPDASKSLMAMLSKTKWRGGTTNVDGKHKRNYHVKFLGEDGKKQDRKLFGLRNDNSWLLDAAQVDMSRVRNRVATDLWNDFATKPYYFDKESKALTGTRGQFVEVFLNDEYRGIYCMTENIDRSQMKLKKYTENKDATVTVHGQLWKSGGLQNAMSWSSPEPYDNNAEAWGTMEVKYPDIDDVCPTDWSTLYKTEVFVDNFKYVGTDEAAALSPGEVRNQQQYFRDHAAEHFDIPVLTDYLLFCNVLYAIDNLNGKNIFWACYDKQVSELLTLAPWDLDCTVGGYFTHTEAAPAKRVWPYQPAISNESRLFYTMDRFNVCDVHTNMVRRYRELRSSFLSNESLKSRYTKYMDMLTKAGAYSRDAARWDKDSDVGGKSFDYAAERDNICQWIDQRLDYLDHNIDDTPEQHYYRGRPVMEIETDRPVLDIAADAAPYTLYVTADNGENVYYSTSDAVIVKDAITGIYSITLSEPGRLLNDSGVPSATWWLCPDTTTDDASLQSIFCNGHLLGTYRLTDQSPESGIVTVTTDTNRRNAACYNVAGMAVGNNYSGIVIIDGKKHIRR